MFNKLKAFTLAEILLTILIIGIVAAMTIPSLIQNIQDRQFKEAAKKAYSEAADIVKQMKTDRGDLSDLYPTGYTFKPLFSKYFKVAKECNWNDCVPGVGASDVYKALDEKTKAYTYWMNFGQFVSSDGMFWAIYNRGSSWPQIYIAVDVNGYTKGPNVYGRDTYWFQLLNDVLLPIGAPGTDITNNTTYCNKAVSDMLSGLTCMYYVMQGTSY